MSNRGESHALVVVSGITATEDEDRWGSAEKLPLAAARCKLVAGLVALVGAVSATIVIAAGFAGPAPITNAPVGGKQVSLQLQPQPVVSDESPNTSCQAGFEKLIILDRDVLPAGCKQACMDNPDCQFTLFKVSGPSAAPTGAPTQAPTAAPTGASVATFTSVPTAAPTALPTEVPTKILGNGPSGCYDGTETCATDEYETKCNGERVSVVVPGKTWAKVTNRRFDVVTIPAGAKDLQVSLSNDAQALQSQAQANAVWDGDFFILDNGKCIIGHHCDIAGDNSVSNGNYKGMTFDWSGDQRGPSDEFVKFKGSTTAPLTLAVNPYWYSGGSLTYTYVSGRYLPAGKNESTCASEGSDRFCDKDNGIDDADFSARLMCCQCLGIDDAEIPMGTCTLGRGLCVEVPEIGASLSYVRPQLQPTKPPAAAITSMKCGKGCSNWNSILLQEFPGKNIDFCETSCRAHGGCYAYNVQMEEGCDGMPGVGTCYLFGEGCNVEDSPCWTLFTLGH